MAIVDQTPGRARPAQPPPPLQPATIDPLVVGRRIRHLRQARGLTLDELGSRIGRAASQISCSRTATGSRG